MDSSKKPEVLKIFRRNTTVRMGIKFNRNSRSNALSEAGGDKLKCVFFQVKLSVKIYASQKTRSVKGCCSRNVICLSSLLGNHRSSASKKATYSPELSFIPRFRAAAGPWFDWCTIFIFSILEYLFNISWCYL